MRTPLSLPLPPLLPFSLLLLLPACAAEFDTDPSCEDGQCEDLVGKHLTLIADGAPHYTEELPDVFWAQPRLEFRGDDIRVLTPDVRIPDGDTFVKIQPAVRGAYYGFELQYRVTGGEWKTVDPSPSSDEPWYWAGMGFDDLGDGTYNLYGVAAMVSDRAGGLAAKAESKTVTAKGWRMDEVRLLALPLWDFWNFDEEGHVAGFLITEWAQAPHKE